MCSLCGRDLYDSGLIWNVVSDVELFGKMVGLLCWCKLVVGKIDNAGLYKRYKPGGLLGGAKR